MSEVAVRELRNNTSDVLHRVESGEEVFITVRGRPVAQLVPVQRSAKRWITRDELARRLRTSQADAGLTADLERLAGETTDDLGPLW